MIIIDPLTHTFIEEPVLLDNNIIVDKYIIYKHIIENENNPFNREYLTINQLENYNYNNKQREILNKYKIDLQLELNKISVK